MRTYDRDTFLKAQKAWEDVRLVGWERIRAAAAERGMLFPPDGSRWDSWEDESPTQVAKIEYARQNNEPELLRIIGQSRTWFQVVGGIHRFEAHVREMWTIREEDRVYDEERDVIGHRESTQALAAILQRIADSAGIDR